MSVPSARRPWKVYQYHIDILNGSPALLSTDLARELKQAEIVYDIDPDSLHPDIFTTTNR